MTGATFRGAAAIVGGNGKSGRDKLHLLTPAQPKPLLDAVIAIGSPGTADEEFIDPFWHSSATHQDAP